MIEKKSNALKFVGDDFELKVYPRSKGRLEQYVGKEVIMGIRPSDIYDEAQAKWLQDNERDSIMRKVDFSELMGDEIYLYLKVGKASLVAKVGSYISAAPGRALRSQSISGKSFLRSGNTESHCLTDTPELKELSKPGRKAYSLPELDVPAEKIDNLIPEQFLADDPPPLPELSEVDVIRHFTNLSSKNFGVDSGFYPLGSCTMKYNPKVNEDIAKLPGFTDIDPRSGRAHGAGNT